MSTILFTLSALLVGVSKAGFGGGPGILVGPVLAIFFPGKLSVAWMLPLLFACDLVALIPYWRKWDPVNVRHLIPGAMVGILLAIPAFRAIPDEFFPKVIGGLAVLFSVLQILRGQLAKKDIPMTPTWWSGFLVGVLTGFVSTLSHVGGLVTSMYLLSQRMDSQRFVATTTLFYFMVNCVKIPAYIYLEVLDLSVFGMVLPYIPVVGIGVFIGVWLNRHVQPKWFGRIVLFFVFASGIYLLLQPVS